LGVTSDSLSLLRKTWPTYEFTGLGQILFLTNILTGHSATASSKPTLWPPQVFGTLSFLRGHCTALGALSPWWSAERLSCILKCGLQPQEALPHLQVDCLDSGLPHALKQLLQVSVSLMPPSFRNLTLLPIGRGLSFLTQSFLPVSGRALWSVSAFWSPLNLRHKKGLRSHAQEWLLDPLVLLTVRAVLRQSVGMRRGSLNHIG
jgi:hypothetical protein